MQNVYFGKFGTDKPEQIDERFYAAGEEGNSWYGGMKVGDYIFPIFKTQVLGLWQVKEYTEKQNRINQDNPGVALFNVIKTFNEPISVQQFLKSPEFDLDINLLNKIYKSTNGCGFFKIKTIANPEQIEFSKERNIYIVLENQTKSTFENDILVVIDNVKEARIIRFEISKLNGSIVYEPLKDLYEEKNSSQERYTLHELLQYAKDDEAPNKQKYIESVLKALEHMEIFPVSNPIQLYDNILVGRRRTPKDNPKILGTTTLIVGNESEDLIEDLDDYNKYAELLEFNPNLILYGPPGTGKTYATKKIIEAFENRQSTKSIHFDQVEKEGRVKFITFHQSYSYEEFIEGIRPQLEDEAESNTGSDLLYHIEPGILKKLVESASTQLLKSEIPSPSVSLVKETSKVWKVSLGLRSDYEVYKYCKVMNRIAVNWLADNDLTNLTYDQIFVLLEKARNPNAPKPIKDASTLDSLINLMNKGDIVLIYESPTTIRDIGVVQGDYNYIAEESFPHTREVTWLKEFDEPYDVSELNGRIRLTLQTIYELSRINMSDIHQMIQSGVNVLQQNIKKVEPKPYYLIIDEINRGNISKIFGELITLIEKDKRNNLSVTLPYSNKPFTIPKNLYLIGTMNTADRSIAMLDTALRRRFVFVEVEPDYSVFAKLNLNGVEKVNNVVDLEKLLRAINEKITNQLDRDHRIGHAYFMDILTLHDLYKTWYYKVLPLLAEYFYNDLKTIQLVIGNKFFEENGSLRFLNIRVMEIGTPTDFEKAMVSIYKGNPE